MTNTREFSKNEFSDLIENALWTELDYVMDHGETVHDFVGQDYDGTNWIGSYMVSEYEGICFDEIDFPVTLFEAEPYIKSEPSWRAIKDDV